MAVLLHTIALEPARWLPQRVSRSLLDLLPSISAAGFQQVEIYEPHLEGLEASETKEKLAEFSLEAFVLSSYLDLCRADENEVDCLRQRIRDFGFNKVRLFPKGSSNSRSSGTAKFTDQLRPLAESMPDVMFLLETHDGSLADDPRQVTQVVAELDLANVGLLFQPTAFQAEAALAQMAIQKPFIRHIHLQNRDSLGNFATLAEGIIPWKMLLQSLEPAVDLTLEFVPAGVCSVADFQMEEVLRQAEEELRYIRQNLVS